MSLTVNPETNWFATCRDSNLEIIGPMLGYYLRTKAVHFCKHLSTEWNHSKNLDDTDNILSICDKAVIPFVVELSVAERTVKQLEKFVHIPDDTLHAIKVDKPSNDNRSRKMVMHEIRREFHNWAWSCLNTGDVVSLTENSPVQDQIPCLHRRVCQNQEFLEPVKTRSGRFVKKKRFFE